MVPLLLRCCLSPICAVQVRESGNTNLNADAGGSAAPVCPARGGARRDDAADGYARVEEWWLGRGDDADRSIARSRRAAADGDDARVG